MTSDVSEHLLRTAWDRARLLEADLTICTAIGQPDAQALLDVETLAERIRATAPRDVMVRFDVRPGPAGIQILACARELGAHQIIVGRSARRGPTRLAHTGVRMAVLHDADCPVLVAGPQRGSRRILVATDLEDPTAPVLLAAAAEAERDGSVVTALHCARDQSVGLDRLTRRLDELGVAAGARVADAPVARAIIAAAIELEADLVVIGSHAHSAAEQVACARHHARPGIDRLMCGSVAERVTRDAPCSVLLVPVDEPT